MTPTDSRPPFRSGEFVAPTASAFAGFLQTAVNRLAAAVPARRSLIALVNVLSGHGSRPFGVSPVRSRLCRVLCFAISVISTGGILATSASAQLGTPSLTLSAGNASVVARYSTQCYVDRAQIYKKEATDTAFVRVVNDSGLNVPRSKSYTIRNLANGFEVEFYARLYYSSQSGTCVGVSAGWYTSSTSKATPLRIYAPPDNFAATPGDGQVTLTWDAIGEATKWQSRHRQTGTGWPSAWTDISGSGATTATHTVSGLSNGTSYDFQVRPIRGTTEGSSGTATATPMPAPSAATLSASPGAGQVTLTWTLAAADESILRWQYRQRAGNAAFVDDWADVPDSDAATRRHTVSQLTNNTEYGFQVRAINAYGDGAESNEAKSTPKPVPSAAVLTASPGVRQVALSWTLAGADTGILRWQYRQRAGNAAFADDWADVPDSGAATRRLTVSQLTNNTEYGFQVRAINASGNGAESNEAKSTPMPAPSAAVLTASPGIRQVALSWTLAGADTGILRWQYRQRAGNAAFADDWADVPDSGAATRRLTVSQLTNNTEYGFQVRAINAYGDGAESNEAKSTPMPLPSAAVLTASPGVRQVALSWTLAGADTGILGWQYRQREGSAAFGDDWTDVPGSGAATRDHTVTELTRDAEFGFQVRAVNAVGEGASSNEATATPQQGPSSEMEERVLNRVVAAVAQETLAGAAHTIGQRFDAAPGAQSLTLAGRRVGGAGPGLRPGRGIALGGALDGIGSRGDDPSYGVDGEALLRDSAFALSLANEEAGADGPYWTVWGRGDWRGFEGRRNGDSWDGKQRAGWLGADVRLNDRLMAGAAASRSRSEANYRLDEFDGSLDTTLTAIWPYAQMTANNGGALRLVLGAGKGEAEHRAFTGNVEKADLSLLTGSASGRLPVARLGGLSLSAFGSASLSQIETDKSSSAPSLGGLSARSWRLRGGVEAERDGFAPFSVSDWLLRPRGALTVRQDGGDGVTGSGIEVSGGMRMSAPGGRFSVDASGRWLALHSESGTQEWGASLESRLAPESDGRGLSLALGPSWGSQLPGALTREPLFDRMRDQDTPQRLSLAARAGYGIAAAGGLLTPFADLALDDGSGTQHYRTGIRFARRGIGTALTVERRNGIEPDTRVGLDLRIHN